MPRDDDYCQCCDLPTASCGKAAEQRQRADAASWAGELVARGFIRAQYPGTCEGCGERFSVGDLIRMDVAASPAGWRSECCA